MRILLVHNHYQVRGGEDESVAAEARLLQAAGHEVKIYSESNDQVAAMTSLSLARRTVWSSEAYHLVRRRLQASRYDVVHVQNFFPLISPSVYYAARDENVPVVQTLRNYRLLCPNGLFFRHGQVCEDCLGKALPYPGVVHRCYRNSWSASSAVAAMLVIHRILRTWQTTVRLYVTLTNFARDKLIQGGLPEDKIVVKPNFVDPDPGPGTGGGDYALYVGRLSVEKGLDTLLAAWQRVGDRLPLKIVGDGPLVEHIAQVAAQSSYLEWLGRQPIAEVYALMGDATVVIFPSTWYETFGRVAIEAFAKGTPVIATNIGAIAEIIESGRTGLHFRPGDADDLAAKVTWLLARPQELARMRREARAVFETHYTAHNNYEQLMALYSRAVQ